MERHFRARRGNAGATRNRQSGLNHLAYDMPYLYIFFFFFFFFPVIAALIHAYQDPGVSCPHPTQGTALL
jgi:hypothetical protein